MNARMIISFTDRQHAELTKAMLESYGIPVYMRCETDSGYPGDHFSAYGFRIYVPADSYEDAVKLLAYDQRDDTSPRLP